MCLYEQDEKMYQAWVHELPQTTSRNKSKSIHLRVTDLLPLVADVVAFFCKDAFFAGVLAGEGLAGFALDDWLFDASDES